MAEAPDDRTALPHHRIGDEFRSVGDKMVARCNNRRDFQRGVSLARADLEKSVAFAHIGEFRNRIDVEQNGGLRQAEAHRGNQTLPARQHAGVASVLGERCERFVG